MAVKKIVFRSLSTGGKYSFISLGGIRFYNLNNVKIDTKGSGVLSSTNTSVETEKITATASSAYSTAYSVWYSFDSTLSQTGTYPDAYWLSDVNNNTLTITFKTPLSSLAKIEFVPNPDTAYTNRGVGANFFVDIYNENDIVEKTYEVVPITTKNTVQSLGTPEFGAKHKVLIKSNGEVKSVVKTVDATYTADVTPKMTSNTAPSGKAEASSFHSSYPPFNAFDDVYTGSGWMTYGGNITGWLSYEFSTVKRITKYTLRGSTVARMPKNWTFEGSNDGLSWTILDTRTDIVDWATDTPKEYYFKNAKSYLKYRINITVNNGDANYLNIGEMEMMETSTPKIVGHAKAIGVTTPTENDFLTYGFDSLSDINVSEMKEVRKCVMPSSTNLGSGKTFEQTLDLKKYPLKKLTFE